LWATADGITEMPLIAVISPHTPIPCVFCWCFMNRYSAIAKQEMIYCPKLVLMLNISCGLFKTIAAKARNGTVFRLEKPVRDLFDIHPTESGKIFNISTCSIRKWQCSKVSNYGRSHRMVFAILFIVLNAPAFLLRVLTALLYNLFDSLGRVSSFAGTAVSFRRQATIHQPRSCCLGKERAADYV